MRVAIVGSREFTDGPLMRSMMEDFPKDTVIVSGGAKGADTLAVNIAQDLGLETKVWLPDWDRYGQKAGFLRNRQIVADCDRVIAFFGPKGITPGTKHTITVAMDMGVNIAILFQRP